MLPYLRKYLLLLTLGTTSLVAQIPTSIENWHVTADFLYLMPTIDDTHFVIAPKISDISNPTGTRRGNDFFFQPGYRVAGGMTFCNCGLDAEIAYTWLHAHKAKNVAGEFLWATQGTPDFSSLFQDYPGSAHSRLNLLYERADALLFQTLVEGCDWDLSLIFGMEYAYLRLREHYTYISSINTGTVALESKSYGVGPQMGLEFNYELFELCRFLPGTVSLIGSSSASLLSGQTKSSQFNGTQGTTFLDTNDRREWRIIPALHASVGVVYETCLSSYHTAFAMGYEYSSYLRGVTRVIYAGDVSDGLSYNTYNNFDIQGLFISASVAF